MKIIKDTDYPFPEGLFICYDKINGKKNQAISLLKKLADYVSLDGNTLNVLKNESGKPFGKINDSSVGVSITHSKDIICCGLYKSGEIGLDVEARNRNVVYGLRKRILHENELSIVEDMDTIRLWTIKEAALKLTGSGLRTAMKKVEIKKADNQYFNVNVGTMQSSIISFELDEYWLSVAYLPTNAGL
ncbi:MAG: 4'-phosphopantetheinyl transferase superfamily protein [Balneolales bacterium]